MSPLVLLLLAQSAAPATAPDPLPADIEIRARVEAREVTIRQQGTARIDLRAEPGGTDIAVERRQPAGQTAYRNLRIDLKAEARLVDPQIVTAEQNASTGEPEQ